MKTNEIVLKEQLDDLINSTEFYIYGAGKICFQLVDYIVKEGKNKCIKAILVSDTTNNPSDINGFSVMKYEQGLLVAGDIVIVAMVSAESYKIADRINNDVPVNVNLLRRGLNNLPDLSLSKKKIDNICEILKAQKSDDIKEDIRFFSPPYWDSYSPFSAVPCLVAQLRRKGYIVGQVDLGIMCMHSLIRNKWKEVATRCSSLGFYKTSFENFRNNEYLDYEQYKNSLYFFDGESFDYKRVKADYPKMNAVHKRVIDSFYARLYSIDSSNFDFEHCTNLDIDVLSYAESSFLDQIIEPQNIGVFNDLPGIVGVSITSSSQFLPGCLLAYIIKKICPETKIIMGGSCADLFLRSEYNNKQDIQKYFDYIIIGEGETSISMLMDYLEDSKVELNSIPNLVCFSRDGGYKLNQLIIEDVSDLPAPDYDGLNLDLYLAPELILPYQTSRGCHYGMCAFCNHDEKYRHNYRSKDMKKVVDELVALSKKHNCNHFQFVDEAIRPDCFRQMIDEMEKNDSFDGISWFYYSRVSRQYDTALLKRAKACGCDMVMFGVESFNQRLLNLIKKGITADTSRYCLKLFHECGIKTFAWLMCNLPSETIEEVRRDLDDVKEMSPYIDAFTIGAFYLDKNTDMYNSPKDYNITYLNDDDPLRFDSEYEGVTIDKEAMLQFFTEEYSNYRIHHYSRGNRYTLFFE